MKKCHGMQRPKKVNTVTLTYHPNMPLSTVQSPLQYHTAQKLQLLGWSCRDPSLSSLFGSFSTGTAFLLVCLLTSEGLYVHTGSLEGAGNIFRARGGWVAHGRSRSTSLAPAPLCLSALSQREIPRRDASENGNHRPALMNSCVDPVQEQMPLLWNAKKKKALVSWDKASCLRGKANEIISMTQDLVRMFHIYWVYSVLSRYFPMVQMPYINHSHCIWIPCSLCMNCSPWLQASLSLHSPLPSTPQQLREICWPVSLKTRK